MRLNVYGNQPIMTPRDPQVPMEAANKNYVDNSIISHANNLDLHLTASQNVLLDNLTVTYQELNNVSGLTGNVQDQIDGKVAKTGDTMSGYLTLSDNPIDNLHAATKQYVDNRDTLKVSKAGDTMSGPLVLSGDPTSALQASTKQYVDSTVDTHASNSALHITTEQNTFLDSLTVTHTEVNQLTGITSNVQSQIDSKVSKAGDTMTGHLTLNADPTANLHAATKQFVEAQDALRVSKAGDTMSGPLVLPGDPLSALQAAPKQYVDSTVATHATNDSLHVTPGQNALLDALTVTSTEINSLAGISDNVQSLLDLKFDKAGGLITGDVTLDTGKTIFVSKTPEDGTEVVNKSYVDALLKGQKWEDPVTDINLIGDNLSAPPSTPVEGDVYIIGSTPTGAWAGKAGYAAFYKDSAWVYLQDRPVAAGDRFGVSLVSSTTPTGSFAGKEGKLITIVTATPGAITFTEDTITAGSTTLVFDPQSSKFGVSYTLTDEGDWIPTNTSVNLTAGEGLSLNGNILNFNYGNGLENVDDIIKVKIDSTNGIHFDINGALYIPKDGSTITITSAGIKVSDTVMADIADRLSKTGTSTVSGSVTFNSTSSLKTEFTPTVSTDVVNKGYVDAADSNLEAHIDAVESVVTTLNTDPVTKTYVDTQDATKVSKAGDTMTGHLTLNADPTSNLHAATKQYVDSGVSSHANDASMHITPTQNALLDALVVTATEVNQLQGITDNVQTQIDSKVNRSGDIMEGPLQLASNPILSMEATTKQYVDSRDDLKVNKSGDTMTGHLTLNADPTSALHAATKQYVDTGLGSHANDDAKHITAAQNTLLDGITVTFTEVNQLTGVTSNIQDQINSKLNLSGGTLTGFLTLHADPTANLQAATKQYVDTQDALKVAKAGDTMTGPLVLSGNPTQDLEAATKQYVDGNISTLTSYVDTQDATKVSKAGDTMTGHLTLSGAPVADLHASTKLYVDTTDLNRKSYVDAADANLQSQIYSVQAIVDTLNADPVTKMYVDAQDATKVSKAGDTMTGYLTLHADPQQNMHPATKQYVDAVAQGLRTKPSVRYATTENIDAIYNNGTFGVNSTLTGASNGALVVDGATVIVGDRILVRDQTNKAHNGDYVVQQVGDVITPFILKRVETIDESHEVPGSYFYVYDGATLKGTGWVLTVDNPVTFSIGNNNIYVSQFSGQGSIIAGNGLTLDGNTIQVNTVDPTRIVINSDAIDLATTGVTPGSYTKVTVDGYGRVTTATNPNTLAGYGITDGQPLNANLTSLSGVTTTGIVVRDATNSITTKAVTVNGIGLSITNGSGANSGDIEISSNATSVATPETIVSRDASGNFSANIITAGLNGNASTATALQTSRTFSATGDVTAPAASFDGTANVTLNTTLSETGVTPGTYTKLTVDAKGRTIVGQMPTNIADLGITDVYTKEQVDLITEDLRKQLHELHLYVMSRI